MTRTSLLAASFCTLLFIGSRQFQSRINAEQAPAESNLRQIEQQADRLLAANRLQDAAEIYRKALTVHPAWKDGWWKLGTLAYDTGDYAECRASLARYLSFQPGDGSAWALKGLSEFELGESRQSLTDLQHADRLGMTEDENLERVAKVHELLLLNVVGDFDNAFHLVQKLSSTECSSQILIEGTGLTALRMKMLPRDLPKDREDLVLGAGRAVCDATANHSTAANTQFLSLIDQYPNEPQLHYLYGCFLLKDHPDEGLTQLSAELAISKSHVPAMTLLALEYLRRGQASEALSYAERAVAIANRSAQAQFALGKCLIDLHRMQDGIGHLSQAARLAPNDRQILWSLAAAYTQLNDPAAAQRVRRQMAKLDQAGDQN
jgi:tetratricopeptide (TPR) repeat protein